MSQIIIDTIPGVIESVELIITGMKKEYKRLKEIEEERDNLVEMIRKKFEELFPGQRFYSIELKESDKCVALVRLKQIFEELENK